MSEGARPPPGPVPVPVAGAPSGRFAIQGGQPVGQTVKRLDGKVPGNRRFHVNRPQQLAPQG